MRRTYFTSAFAMLAVAGSAIAGTPPPANDDTKFDVSATIAAECVVGQASELNFGGLGMLDTNSAELVNKTDLTTAGFKATCTNGTLLPTLQFKSGNGGSTFKMITGGGSDAEVIEYSLYQGVGTSGTRIAHDTPASFAEFTADGSVKDLTITGQVLQTDKDGKKVGKYTDTVTITVGFYTPP